MPGRQKLIGLIGFPLSHSFSNKYFTEKFERESIADFAHSNFEVEDISHLPKLILEHPDLVGLNVTIPHKVSVIPLLDELDPVARKIGAVNTIRIHNGKLSGYNTDYYGFRQSLEEWAGEDLKRIDKALILGTGGASRAILVALQDVGISATYVSRTPDNERLSYEQLHASSEQLREYRLIINCTPLGTYPDIETKPSLPYSALGPDHLLYDLVYNPAETAFLKAGSDQGARIKNGLQMLHLQAEKSWTIWTA